MRHNNVPFFYTRIFELENEYMVAKVKEKIEKTRDGKSNYKSEKCETS